MALVVGAALAVAGAVMQAMFGNPLAEPGVVGVSAGAALGAATAIVLGLARVRRLGLIAVPAFAGGLLATLLVYLVSRGERPHRGRHAAAHRHRGQRLRRARASPSCCSRERRRAASRSSSGSSDRSADRAGARC